MKTFFENSEEVFAIAAAMLVLFTAMMDARVSVAIAGLFIVVYSAREILARKTRARNPGSGSSKAKTRAKKAKKRR